MNSKLSSFLVVAAVAMLSLGVQAGDKGGTVILGGGGMGGYGMGGMILAGDSIVAPGGFGGYGGYGMPLVVAGGKKSRHIIWGRKRRDTGLSFV